MFGLTTKRAAQRRAQETANMAVAYAAAKLNEDLRPAVEAARLAFQTLERDLEISQEREAEANAEIKRLRAENRYMLAQIADVRAALSCPGHAVVDDFGTEFFIFAPSSASL